MWAAGLNDTTDQDITESDSLYGWVIDQPCGIDGLILAKFFSYVYIDRDLVKVCKQAIKQSLIEKA